MIYIGALISLLFIVLAARWLVKKNNPQGVLMVAGIAMLALGMLLGLNSPAVSEPSGWAPFDIFKVIKQTFASNMLRVGLMIMTIGGYVAYMKRIKASEALVYVSMRPLAIFKKYPYVAASIVIPIGQLLFICTPSATGLGLLLVASIFPILVGLGVSRLTAVSVISACTLFDMGPGSANTARAAEIVGVNNMLYFVEYQLPLTIPLVLLLMVVYYFTNRYFDRRDRAAALAQAGTEMAGTGGTTETTGERTAGTEKTDAGAPGTAEFKVDVPLIYALLPMLPLLLLIVFSKYVRLFDPPIELDTTTAMFVSLAVAMIFELVRHRSFRAVFGALKSFWDGMGNVFANVVTLIVAAEIFSNGLISLGFIDALVEGCTSLGLGGVFVSVVIVLIIFLAAILMGSGNASFFSFGPLVPSIASRVGMSPVDMVLPMQLSSSMGRAASPIAGVIIAISEIAGVAPMDLAKRNVIPLVITLAVMIVLHFFVY